MSSALPAARIPFPVKTPFKTATDLYKLGRPLRGRSETALIEFDDAFVTTIQEKLSVFRQARGHSLLYLPDDAPALGRVLWRVADAIAADQPAYLTCDDTGYTSHLLGYTFGRDGSLATAPATFPELGAACQGYLASLSGMARFCAALALSVQEDLVLMHNPTGQPNADRAEALLVALPSHWDPAEKLGLSFHDIHIPVGDNTRLLQASPNLMDAIVNKGPFVRYNWTLASVPNLCQNPTLLQDQAHTLADPALAVLPPVELVRRLYFRSERQTLVPFPDEGRSLFNIRIFQAPLPDALQTPGRAGALADALASMSPAHLEYRAMTGIINTLLTGLRAWD